MEAKRLCRGPERNAIEEKFGEWRMEINAGRFGTWIYILSFFFSPKIKDEVGPGPNTRCHPISEPMLPAGFPGPVNRTRASVVARGVLLWLQLWRQSEVAHASRDNSLQALTPLSLA